MRRLKTGFTYLEILVVVVIIGVIAAIAIAHFMGPKEDKSEAELISQLETIRNEIEHYKMQHKGALPDLTTDWTILTTRTDGDGAPSAATDAFGPYLPAVPVNPINGLSTVADADGLSGTAPGECGYIYDYNGGTGTGRIWGTRIDKTSKFE